MKEKASKERYFLSSEWQNNFHDIEGTYEENFKVYSIIRDALMFVKKPS